MRTKSLVAFLFSFLLVTIAVEQADAQRRGGRGGQGPIEPEEIAKNRTEQMHEIMTLTDAQKEKVSELNLAYAKKMQDLRTGRSGDRRQVGQALRTMNEEWDKELKALVSEAQWEKWTAHIQEQRQNRRRRGGPNN